MCPAVTFQKKKAVYQLRPGLFRVRVLVVSRGHFSEKKAVYQLRPGLFRVRVLVVSRGHFSGIKVVYRTLEGQSIICGPRSVFNCNSCVPVVSHVAGVKMEPVEVAKVIRSEKGKDLLVSKGLKFRFQKNSC